MTTTTTTTTQDITCQATDEYKLFVIHASLGSVVTNGLGQVKIFETRATAEAMAVSLDLDVATVQAVQIVLN